MGRSGSKSWGNKIKIEVQGESEKKGNKYLSPLVSIFRINTEKMCEEFYYSEHLFHLNEVVLL